MTDLEEAIPMVREALSLDPLATHRYRLVALKNLAVFLDARFKENGSQSDFEEAISLRQEILAMSKMNFITPTPLFNSSFGGAAHITTILQVICM